jgi:hypothetical protein
MHNILNHPKIVHIYRICGFFVVLSLVHMAVSVVVKLTEVCQ